MSRCSVSIVLCLVAAFVVAGCGPEPDPSPASMVEVARDVAEGLAADGAPAYAGAGPHKYAPYGVYSISGDATIPEEWEADTVSELQLVAVFTETYPDSGRTWTAAGGQSYPLQWRQLNVVLREARTAAVVTSKTWLNNRVPTVADVRSGNARPTAAVSGDDLIAWLSPYIQDPR